MNILVQLGKVEKHTLTNLMRPIFKKIVISKIVNFFHIKTFLLVNSQALKTIKKFKVRD